MRLFIDHLDTAALDSLVDRARGRCLAFNDSPLPPGCSSPTGRVGIEASPYGVVTVLVERGFIYDGNVASVQTLLADGELRFDDLAAFADWVDQDLRRSYSDDDPADPDVEMDGVDEDVRALLLAREAASEPQMDGSTLAAAIRRNVVGQDRAISTLVAAVERHVAKAQPRGPLNLMAIGPTGVGKTAVFEELATHLTTAGNQWGFLRVDMNQFSEAHRVSELFGAPPGYLGHGSPAPLVQALAGNERTLVLFDEVEKAHPSILLTLMNAMDVGRLNSSTEVGGRHEIDCRRAIFVFTTNRDARNVLRALDASGRPEDPGVVDRICAQQLAGRGVPQELVSRITGFLVFRPLEVQDRARALGRALVHLGTEYGVQVMRVDPSLLGRLLDHDTAPSLGMRPLVYLVDRMVGSALADAARTGATHVELVDGAAPGWKPWESDGDE